MDPIYDNDKTYEKCGYCNNNLNELEMNDTNGAYKNRLYKTHFNLNKSFKSRNKQLNRNSICIGVALKKIDGINMRKNLKKGWSKKKLLKKT